MEKFLASWTFRVATDRRVIADFRRVLTTRNKITSMYRYVAVRGREMNSYFPSPGSYESSDSTGYSGLSGYREARRAIDQNPLVLGNAKRRTWCKRRYSAMIDEYGHFSRLADRLVRGRTGREGVKCLSASRLWANRWCFCNKFQVDAIGPTAWKRGEN